MPGITGFRGDILFDTPGVSGKTGAGVTDTGDGHTTKDTGAGTEDSSVTPHNRRCRCTTAGIALLYPVRPPRLSSNPASNFASRTGRSHTKPWHTYAAGTPSAGLRERKKGLS